MAMTPQVLKKFRKLARKEKATPGLFASKLQDMLKTFTPEVAAKYRTKYELE